MMTTTMTVIMTIIMITIMTTIMITIMTIIMPTVIVSPLAAQLLFRSAAADQVGTPAPPDDGWWLVYIYL